MRIIAGTYKSRKLLFPKKKSIRPTMDRVRESIFNMLSTDVFGATVLDLFAGSGSLGFEALSRGASSAYFIDTDAIAIRTIQENARLLQVEENVTIRKQTAESALMYLKKNKAQCNLVFMDPPYENEQTKKTLMKLMQSDILAPKNTIVVEHSVKSVLEGHEKLLVHKSKIFGSTQVTILEAVLK